MINDRDPFPFISDTDLLGQSTPEINRSPNIFDKIRTTLDKVHQIVWPDRPYIPPDFARNELDSFFLSPQAENGTANEIQAAELRDRQVTKRRRLTTIGLLGGVVGVVAASVLAANRMLDGEESVNAAGTTQEADTNASSTIPETTNTPSQTMIERLEQTEPSIVYQSSPETVAWQNQIDSLAKLDGDNNALRCESVDVTIPTNPRWEDVQEGAKTEFVITQDELQKLSERLANTTSISEAQAIFREVTDAYRINVRFDDVPSDYDPVSYINSLSGGLAQLSLLPADFLEIPGTHELIITTNNLVNGFDAAGYYTAYSGEVTIQIESLARALIHEFSHALHDYICRQGLYQDDELQEIFDEIISGLESQYPEFKELREKYDISLESGIAMDPAESETLRTIYGTVGIPREYAGRDKSELFAELANSIIEHGYLSLPDSPAARKIQEVVIERMQAAMPDVNVAAWLQYKTYYSNFEQGQGGINPKTISDLNLSRFDGSIYYINEASVKNLYPAVALQAGDHTEFIYAIADKSADYVFINIIPTGDSILDQKLIEAAQSYLYASCGDKYDIKTDEGKTTLIYIIPKV